MTVTKIANVSIPSSTNEGSGNVQYNESTMVHVGNITLRWLGGTLNFASVGDYTDFINNVVIPLTNIMNSPSGSGSGYVAMSVGVPGSDKVL